LSAFVDPRGFTPATLLLGVDKLQRLFQSIKGNNLLAIREGDRFFLLKRGQ